MTAPAATRFAAAALVALAFAGCGGEEEEGPQIPRGDASALINRLEEAQRRSDPFRCNDLREDTLPALERQLAALPENVDADVRSTVEDGIAHLSRLVDEECERTREEKTKTETTPTTPSEAPTTPAPTETKPEETTPAPTAPAPVPEPEPEEPGGGGAPAPDDDGGGAAVPGTGNGKKPRGTDG